MKKIELVKGRVAGQTWYYIQVDGWCKVAKLSLEEAEAEFDLVVDAESKPEESNIIKSVQI
jgi:hypothetical protein